jgi:DNA-binding NtrC family response regulator
MTPGFLRALTGHNWPGNVRELQNVVERSLVLADDTAYLSAKDLPQEFQDLHIPEGAIAGPFHDSVRAFKRELVRSALRMHGGNRLHAARELGISRCYLHRLLNQLNINDVADSEGELAVGPSTSRSESRELAIADRVA